MIFMNALSIGSDSIGLLKTGKEIIRRLRRLKRGSFLTTNHTKEEFRIWELGDAAGQEKE